VDTHFEKYREIVGILMESTFYFELSLLERHSLIKHLLSTRLRQRILTH